MERPSALLRRFGSTSGVIRRALVASVALGLVTTAAVVVQAVGLASALSALFRSPHGPYAHGVELFALATVVRAAAAGLAEPLTARIAAPLRRDLRGRALESVLALGPRGSVDATVQLGTRGVEAIESYLAGYVPALVLAAASSVVMVVWLSVRDWLSGVIVLVTVALLPVFMILLGRAAKERMRRRWAQQQRLASYFGDVVRGMTVLKSFNRSSDAVERLDDVGRSLRRTTMDTLRVAFLSSLALELLASLATALVALELGLRLLDGSLALSTALAVLLVAPEVYLPMRRASARYHASANGIAAADELLTVLERPVSSGVATAPVLPPTLELVDLDLSREGRHASPAGLVRATIPAGRLATVTGPSGIGKTTLLRIICGLRRPAAGTVLVDGVDLADLDGAAWHRRVAWLSQDPLLPGVTVRDAVTLGQTGIDDDAIVAALAEVGLDLKLERPLGEGSLELSAGERRRLALARCLVRRPVLLVLDEPTAHLDAESAALVMRAVLGLSMTRVVATHRPFPADLTIALDASELGHAH